MLQSTDRTPIGTAAFQRSGVRVIDIADGVLLGLRHGSIENSFIELLDVARRYSLPPLATAEALVAEASGHRGCLASNSAAAHTVAFTPHGQRAGAVGTDVVTDEWGEDLSSCRAPVRPSACP